MPDFTSAVFGKRRFYSASNAGSKTTPEYIAEGRKKALAEARAAEAALVGYRSGRGLPPPPLDKTDDAK